MNRCEGGGTCAKRVRQSTIAADHGKSEGCSDNKPRAKRDKQTNRQTDR